jgi:hypothetical protein
MFNRFNGKRINLSHDNAFTKKKERLTNTETLFLGGMGVVNYSLIFVFRGVFWKLASAKSEG